MLLPWRKEVRRMLRPSLADPGDALDGLARGMRCRIIVSSDLARYALVPFSTAVVGREANEALAALVFRRTHGERADAWRIRLAPGPIGHPRVACALDAALLDRLAAAAEERGVTLTAIEPAFVAGFNAAYRRLPPSCWLAVVEPGRLVLGLLIDGRWRHLVAERFSVDVRRALAPALAREGMLVENFEAAASLPCWMVRFDPEGASPVEVRPFDANPSARAAA